jgi:fructose-bisphosphate aldolase class II
MGSWRGPWSRPANTVQEIDGEARMLVNLSVLLRDARERHYAVPAFDCTGDVLVRAILETAEARQAPVVLMCLGDDLTGNGMAYLPGLIKTVARHHRIPIALHLDHATDLRLIRSALEADFTSVMIDGSRLSFEENVRLTKAAVDLAHPRDVSVEGELGHVGGMELTGTHCGASVLTEAGDVAEFVDRTGVDALAVSIGTAHGVYQSLPQLDLQRLSQLNAVSPVPLVLHGGSGTPVDQLQAAIQRGICKVNIYADLRVALRRGLRRACDGDLRPDPLPSQVFGPIHQEVAQVVTRKINLLGAAERASSAMASGPRRPTETHV